MDVYLLPAVIGGGLGDIEETLAAGRRLAGAGFPIFLYRRAGRALPTSVDGPWAWPRVERPVRLAPSRRSALTITPCWGVSAAPSVSGALGRGGVWADEASEIERTYGPDHTLHVSLEEFGRTLTAARENRERLREGGISARSLGARARASRGAGEVESWRRAFRRFRAFDRTNVLHLFATFAPDPAFAREFPEAVQTGPLWPGLRRSRSAHRASGGGTWVWYASPASAERIAPSVLAGLSSARSVPRLRVRTPRPWSRPLPTGRLDVGREPVADQDWRRGFARADLRIVTGSRTLLEAMEIGGPFLYFNGTLGVGRRARRHRPEKLQGLLRSGAGRRLPEDVRADLADFAMGRRVRSVVRRAADSTGGWARFPRRWAFPDFPRPYADAGELIVSVARRLAEGRLGSTEIVATVRRRSTS